MSTEAGDVQVEYTRIIQCEKPVLKGPELYDVAQRERGNFLKHPLRARIVGCARAEG